MVTSSTRQVTGRRASEGAARPPPTMDLEGVVTSAPSEVLESLPVAAPLQAHDLPEPGRGEVSGRHDDVFALQPVQQGPSRLACQLRIHIGARDPVGLEHLHRAVRRIAEDERALSLRGDRSEEHTSELQSLAYLVCR